MRVNEAKMASELKRTRHTTGSMATEIKRMCYDGIGFILEREREAKPSPALNPLQRYK